MNEPVYIDSFSSFRLVIRNQTGLSDEQLLEFFQKQLEGLAKRIPGVERVEILRHESVAVSQPNKVVDIVTNWQSGYVRSLDRPELPNDVQFFGFERVIDR